MGLLRLLLAISVANSHFGGILGYYFAGAFTAVQMFYVISGFYMATILTEKYDPRKDLGVFFSNRFIRIFSIYFVAALISLIAYYILYSAGRPGWFFADVAAQSALIAWPEKLWIVFTNLFVFGQDSILFLKISDGGFAFAPEGPNRVNELWRLMLVPQAWSISLELMFYCMVPFLIRNSTKTLVGIIAATLVLRIMVYRMGYEADPWMSRFFPLELGLFVMGMVSRRIYDATIGKIGRIPQILVALLFFVVTCSLWRLVEWSYEMRFSLSYIVWPYYFSALIALPCLFQLTRTNKIDNFLGQFSYPVYLMHWAAMIFYDAFAAQLGFPVSGSWVRVVILLALTVVLAWGIVVAIEAPLDRYRQHRFQRRHGLSR